MTRLSYSQKDTNLRRFPGFRHSNCGKIRLESRVATSIRLRDCVDDSLSVDTIRWQLIIYIKQGPHYRIESRVEHWCETSRDQSHVLSMESRSF